MSRVTVDRATGALRIGGAKAFPLGLSNPPPLGAKAPNGVDGLKEVADAGATFIRTGRGDWGPLRLEEQIAAERAVLDAAALHGLHCWVYLGELPDLPPRAAGTQASTREQMLTRLTSQLRNHPALGAYKGVDEPRNPFRGEDWIRPAGLVRALQAPEGARPGAPARDHPGTAEHGRAALALPARLRHHRRRHLPARVPAGRALRPAEQGHQRRRRRHPEDGARGGRQTGLDDAPDRLERHRQLRAKAERRPALPDPARAPLHGLPGDRLRRARAELLRRPPDAGDAPRRRRCGLELDVLGAGAAAAAPGALLHGGRAGARRGRREAAR